MKRAEESLERAKGKGLILDYRVMRCGEGLRFLMSYPRATRDEKVHRLAWETFLACTEVAKRLKLYGALSFIRCQRTWKPDDGAPAPGQVGARACGTNWDPTAKHD